MDNILEGVKKDLELLLDEMMVSISDLSKIVSESSSHQYMGPSSDANIIKDKGHIYKLRIQGLPMTTPIMLQEAREIFNSHVEVYIKNMKIFIDSVLEVRDIVTQGLNINLDIVNRTGTMKGTENLLNTLSSKKSQREEDVLQFGDNYDRHELIEDILLLQIEDNQQILNEIEHDNDYFIKITNILGTLFDSEEARDMYLIKLVGIFESASAKIGTDIPNVMTKCDEIHHDILQLINTLHQNVDAVDRLQDGSIKDLLVKLGELVSRIVPNITNQDIGTIRDTIGDLNNNMRMMRYSAARVGDIANHQREIKELLGIREYNNKLLQQTNYRDDRNKVFELIHSLRSNDNDIKLANQAFAPEIPPLLVAEFSDLMEEYDIKHSSEYGFHPDDIGDFLSRIRTIYHYIKIIYLEHRTPIKNNIYSSGNI